MSLIEHAARALAKSQSGESNFDLLDSDLQESLKADAYAVLQAIREPAPEMVAAGENVLLSTGGATFVDHPPIRDTWIVMIDTAVGSFTVT